MNILIATDKFKDALNAAEAAAAMAEGVLSALPSAKVLQLPLSDGGDGFARLMAAYSGAKLVQVAVSGPLQQTVTACYAWLPRYKRAYIEMAEAAGLQLIPPALRSPLHTTTWGVGQLIRHALEAGAREIALGIGGSATHDLGLGMAAALGYQFLDASGRPLLPTGGSLLQVEKIKKNKVYAKLAQARIQVACDVSNPLYGPGGAAFTYAAQKGASGQQLSLLDSGSRHIAALIERDLGKAVDQLPGSGAAGGLGAGAMAFLNAALVPGANMLLELAGFDNKLNQADLVICGEGKADRQSLQGKVLGEIAKKAALAGKPLLLLCGKLELNTQMLQQANIWHAVPISPAGEPIAKSLQLCQNRLQAAAKESLLFFLRQEAG